jgi:hypothetical protein
MPQPGDADPVTCPETIGAVAEPDNLADNLMPGNHAAAPGRQVTLGQVQVGAADPAGTDPDEHLADPGFRHRTLDQRQRQRRPVGA